MGAPIYDLLGRPGWRAIPRSTSRHGPKPGCPPTPDFSWLACRGPAPAFARCPTAAPDYSDLRPVDGWRAHLERTFLFGTTANGVFGDEADVEPVGRTRAAPPRASEPRPAGPARTCSTLFDDRVYVWVRRRDKVRQAISLWRAVQTSTWRLEHPERQRCRLALRYSFARIEHLRRRLTADDEAWGRFFPRHGINPLELSTRTDVEPDPAGAVTRVHARGRRRLTSLGRWHPIVRQSDDLSDALAGGVPSGSHRACERLMPPNILYIHSHDTGRDVQPYGHAIPTRTSNGWPIRV